MNLITTNRNRQLMTRCGFTLLASFLLSGTAWAGDAETIADLQARLATVERNVGQLVENEGKVSPTAGIPLHGFFDVGQLGFRTANLECERRCSRCNCFANALKRDGAKSEVNGCAYGLRAAVLSLDFRMSVICHWWQRCHGSLIPGRQSQLHLRLSKVRLLFIPSCAK